MSLDEMKLLLRRCLHTLIRRGIQLVCVGRSNMAGYNDGRFLDVDLLKSV